MAELPIGNGFYISESLPLSHQECSNFIVNIPQAPSLSKVNLVGTPGIIEQANTGAVQQVNRGSWEKGGISYFVNGTTLYNVIRTYDGDDPVFTTNALGTIEGDGRVWMESNTTQLVVLNPGGKGYIYNEDDVGTEFQEITDSDFRANGNPTAVVFIDGYFVFTTDENKIISSSLQDGLTYDALDFASVESDPDAVVAPVVVDNQLYVTGTVTAEGFQNIGGEGFPFQRNNVFLDKGCSAPFTLIDTNETFFMVGKGKRETPSVWQFNGSTFEKKSTTAIDNVLANYTDEEIRESFSWSYGQKGHYFVGFTFPDRTFVYDLVTNLWHERKSKFVESQVRWRVNSMVAAYGLILVGDGYDGRIGSLDINEYGEYGEDILSRFSTQPFGEMNGYAIPVIEATIESGVGNDCCEDPKMALAISRNGKKFNQDKVRSMGKKGQYDIRQVWRRNGRVSRFATLRFSISAQVKKVVIKVESK